MTPATLLPYIAVIFLAAFLVVHQYDKYRKYELTVILRAYQ